MATGEPKLAVVVQARMSSRRLPGKVLLPLAGKPLLAHVLERLEAGQPWPVVVATSTDPSDDFLADFCAQAGVLCLRGPLENVAARFLLAAEALGLEAFVRVCGDSPLIDPGLVARAVDLFLAERPDLAVNVFPRSFPQGQSVEVLDAEVFRRAAPGFARPEDREHVTPYFYRHPDRYRILNLAHERDLSGLRLVVDTPGDLELVAGIMKRMDRPSLAYGLEEIAALHRAAREETEGAGRHA